MALFIPGSIKATGGGVQSSAVVNVQALAGITNVKCHRIGQSNETSYTSNTYTPGGGGEWNGSSVVAVGQKNTIGRLMEQYWDDDGIQFTWVKTAVGSTTLSDYYDGGTHNATMLADANSLYGEYGTIDLVILFIGESAAGAAVTEATWETEIQTFIDDYPYTPKAWLFVGPPNMSDVLNEREDNIRNGYSDKADEFNNAVAVGLSTIDTDDDLNNHHIVRHTTADAAATLIKTTLDTLF